MVADILCRGYVTSKNDGQVHYITAPKLARLYGLDLSACLVDDGHSLRMRSRKPEPDDVRYYPRYDGDYAAHSKRQAS